ncbi:MAG: hypothetical protein JXQ23_03860 [Clostridia bacterium]|nr:hypothetical protein [Clostridia bacterium]
MIKKTLSILLILVLLLLPVTVSASDYEASYNEYINNSEQLKSLYTTYQDLESSYADSVKELLNYSTGSSLSYYQAYAYINKVTGKIQLDRSLEASKENILRTKMDMTISFRSRYYNLYTLEKSMNDTYSNYLSQLETYNSNVALYKQGYINKSIVDLSDYNKKSAYVSYMSNKRNYENAIREFNLLIGKDYDNTDYKLNIDEKIKAVSPLDVYLESFLENSPTLKSYSNTIEIGEIKIDCLEAYNLDVTSYDAKLDYAKTNISIEITALRKKEYIETSKSDIENLYTQIEFAKRTIDNEAFAIEINKRLMEENRDFYLKGYIEKEEYNSYIEKYENSVKAYKEKIYSYNSMILNLEKTACMYMKGEL